MQSRQKPIKKSFRQQLGLTLIELMVAIALSAFLMVGVTQTFLSNHQSNRLQRSFSRVQESGRLALDFMTRDIRMADFWGCAGGGGSMDIDDNLNPHPGIDYLDKLAGGNGLVGENDVLAGTLAEDGAKVVKTGTDTLTIIKAGGDGGVTVEEPYMNTNSGALHINKGSDLKAGDIVVVANCAGKGDLFEIAAGNVSTSGTITHGTGAAITLGNADKNFQVKYEGDATILKPEVIQYFVSADGTANGNASLWRTVNNAPAIELVPNMEDMQILYGEDENPEDGFVERYSEADVVVDMEKVLTVRIQLLVAGEDSVDIKGAVTFNGAPVAADGRMRKIYTSTTAIRNRL